MQVSGAMSEVLVALPSTATCLSPEFKHFPSFSDSKSFPSGGLSKRCSSFHMKKLGLGFHKWRRRVLIVRASDSSGEESASVAPLHFESPVGQLLEQILQTHPHLLPAAIDLQLENLQNDRDSQKEESSSPSQDLLLYRRIAEVKENERQKALEEIIYCLVVQKFAENEIAMIPKISPTANPTGRVDFWPNQEQKLESVHSPEALELIQTHLSLVLGERLVGPLQTTVDISKIKLGKLYAASIMYGYFIKRVDQRYQLERTMKSLPKKMSQNPARLSDNPPWDLDSLIWVPPEEVEGESLDSGDNESYRLRSYVMYLDTETLQRYATIRSKEVVSLIEKQTQALFGRPDIRIGGDGSLETRNDETITITFSGLTMLVLEAVAFGSFLWDAEDYVESKYHFVNS